MENIYLRESPSKIYIEVTTRCNLNCSMCVKQAEGCGIRDGDFDLNLSRSILSVLPDINTVILSGIGEPLLYNSLSPLIEICKITCRRDHVLVFRVMACLLKSPEFGSY